MANGRSNDGIRGDPERRCIQLGARKLQLLQMSAEMSLVDKRTFQDLLHVLTVRILEGPLEGMKNLGCSRSAERRQQHKSQKQGRALAPQIVGHWLTLAQWDPGWQKKRLPGQDAFPLELRGLGPLEAHLKWFGPRTVVIAGGVGLRYPEQRTELIRAAAGESCGWRFLAPEPS